MTLPDPDDLPPLPADQANRLLRSIVTRCRRLQLELERETARSEALAEEAAALQRRLDQPSAEPMVVHPPLGELPADDLVGEPLPPGALGAVARELRAERDQLALERDRLADELGTLRARLTEERRQRRLEREQTAQRARPEPAAPPAASEGELIALRAEAAQLAAERDQAHAAIAALRERVSVRLAQLDAREQALRQSLAGVGAPRAPISSPQPRAPRRRVDDRDEAPPRRRVLEDPAPVPAPPADEADIPAPPASGEQPTERTLAALRKIAQQRSDSS